MKSFCVVTGTKIPTTSSTGSSARRTADTQIDCQWSGMACILSAHDADHLVQMVEIVHAPRGDQMRELNGAVVWMFADAGVPPSRERYSSQAGSVCWW